MFKQMLRFMLLAALMVPLGARAQNSTLTICDGTANHEYVPFYGYYADANQHNQLIYPADSLTSMVGNAISQMVFYIDQSANNGSSTAADRLGTWTVSLGTTSATTLTGLDDTTTLTQVYEGYFDCSTGTLTLLFEAPYVYNGGNLLVDLQHVAASYNRWYFLGVTDSGASYCYGSQRDFLPKVQFLYGAPPTCLRPSGLQAVVSGDAATISWSDEQASAWDIVWGPSGFAPDTVQDNIALATSTSYEITGLTTGLYQAYVRTNCGDEVSAWLGPVTIGVGIYYMATTGSDTLRTCGTIIYDNGGPNANYSAYCQSTLVILPGQENSVVKISGTSYTEGSWDYLYIYDGIGTEGELLWNDDGVTALQSFGPFVSDAITLVFHSDSGTEYEGFSINVTCEPAPTCARPDSLVVDSVGTDWATLSWQDPVGSAWTIQYGPFGFDPEGPASNYQFADFTTTSGTITELAPGMKYDFYVMSVCGNNEGDTSWTRRASAYTDCDAITLLPYTENFDGLEAGETAEFNPCWTKGANYNTNLPYVYNYSYMGVPSNFLYFYTASYYYDGGREWAVLPTVGEDIEMNTLELSFEAYPLYTYSSYCHNLLVGVIDSVAYTDTMHIDTLAVMNVGQQQTVYVSLANYEGDGRNIILLHWLDGDHTEGYLGLDDISLHLLPQCDRPDSLSLVSTDSTTMTITWWASENSENFYVEWRNADSTGAYSHADVATNSYTIEELSPNTLYDIIVRTVCGDDTSIAVTGQFRTPCVSVTNFPYLEDVETNSVSCWNSFSANNYDGDDWQVYNYNAHSGSNCFYSNYNSNETGTNWLVSPALELPEEMTAASLSYYVSGVAFMEAVPRYAVKISTVSGTDTTTFTTLLDEERDDDNGDYAKRSISLSQYAGQTVYIAFVRYARDDNGFYLDDIAVEELLLPVISIVGTNAPVVGLATTYTARLDEGLSTGLTWNWQSARATAGTATMTPGNAGTISMLYPTAGVDTLTLIGTNTYGPDTAVLVVNPVSIDYAALPYSTGFEAADDRTWTISNGPNGWYIDSAAAASGSYSLYISADSGATNTYDISTSSHSFAYKAFNFANAGQYGLSFDWHNLGENSLSYDYVRVYLVPAGDTNMVGFSGYSTTWPDTWRALGTFSGEAEWQTSSSVIEIDAPGVYNIAFYWYNDGSLGNNPPAAIDNIALAQITCPAPTGLTVDAVTTTTATFHWTSTGSENSWTVQVGNMPLVTVTDTFYTATGLTHSTHYNVKVRALCGAGDTSLVLGGSFWTECDVYTVPFYFNFDGHNGLHTCWSDVVAGGNTPSTSWSNSSTYGNEYIYSNANYVSNPTSDYLISPAIQIPASDTASLRLVLQMAGQPSTYYSSSVAAYQVLVSPNGSDSIAAFTDVLLNDTLNSNIFDFRRLPLGAYAGQTIRFAVRNTSRASGTVYIYDASIRYVNEPRYFVSGSTVAIAGDTNTYIATYAEGDTATMTLSWTSTMAAAGQATILNANTDTMQIIYTAAGIDSITFIAANQYGADTTAFHVRVYVCNVIDQFPYTEGFEAMNPCWMPVYGDGDPEVNPMTISSTNVHSGSGAFRFSSYSNSSDYNQYLISPEISGENLELSFWASRYGDEDHLWVGFSSTTRDTAAFTWMPAEVALSTTMAEFTYLVPENTKYVAFHYFGNFKWYVYLDDVTLSGYVPPCEAPAIDTVMATENSITFNWNRTAANFDVAVLQGAWNDSLVAETLNITDTFYTFNDLQPETQYFVGVRAVCSETNFSEWVVSSITTDMHLCAVPTTLTATGVTLHGATLGWTPGEEGQEAWEIAINGTNYSDTVAVEANPYIATGLVSGVTYSFSVRAVCSETNKSAWSTPESFTTVACEAVTNVNHGVLTDSSAVITWTAPEGATTFEIEYGPKDFSQGAGTTVSNINGTTYTITGLRANRDYDVYVRTVCDESTTSLWSNVHTFHTQEGTGIDDVNSANISLYPNPASSTVTLMGIEGMATVTVVDMNGRESGKWIVTDGTLTIDVTGMAQGAYFVRIVGEQVNAIRKLVVR